jgi:hypothetical protein
VTNDTVAAGMIEETMRSSSPEAGARTQVAAAERRERLGQRGALVSVVAPAGSQSTIDTARDLAFALERELFDRGRIATVVDSKDAAAACARAGLIALLPTSGDTFELTVDGEAVSAEASELDVDALAMRWAELVETRS